MWQLLSKVLASRHGGVVCCRLLRCWPTCAAKVGPAPQHQTTGASLALLRLRSPQQLRPVHLLHLHQPRPGEHCTHLTVAQGLLAACTWCMR